MEIFLTYCYVIRMSFTSESKILSVQRFNIHIVLKICAEGRSFVKGDAGII
jgi:hypothetical protein